MADRIFLDTNILVYCFDTTDRDKKIKAGELFDSLYDTEGTIISIQVVEEFCSVAFRKMSPPLSEEDIIEFISTIPPDRVRLIDMDTINEALTVKKEHSLSFWDSLIVAAALNAGCTVLYTEDMQHGYSVKGLTIRNPFI